MALNRKQEVKSHFLDLKKFLETDVVEHDFHIHTGYSGDARDSITDAVLVAKQRGLKALCITEHVWESSKWIRAYLDEGRKISSESDISLFLGVEAKVVDEYGNIDFKETFLPDVDLVIGSVHGFNKCLGLDPATMDAYDVARIETDLMVNLAKNPSVMVVGHPYRTLLSWHKVRDVPTEHWRRFFSAVIEYEKVVEINGRYSLPSPEMICWFLENGGQVSLGSDAHRKDDIGKIDISRYREVLL